LKGEGETFEERGFAPLKLPQKRKFYGQGWIRNIQNSAA